MKKTHVQNGRKLREDVEALLTKKCKRWRVPAKISEIKAEGVWTLVLVAPSREGVRGFDFVEALSEVEEELQAKGYEHVLVLPASPD